MNLVKFALPAVLSLCLAGTIHAESATDFGPKTKIGRVGGLAKLPSHLQNLYRQFRREANYFAAMAVNFETGDGFYIRNFHDAARARAAAIEGCRQFTGSDGCVLYAVAIPNSLPFDQLDASGLSMLAAKEFNTAYVKRRKPGTFAAFAISGASHHGYGDAYDTAEDAKDSAIAYCNIYVAKDMAEMGPQARKYARARNWQECKVVDVAFTPAE